MKRPSFYDDVRGVIAGQCARLGASDEDIYTKAEISKSTYFSRKKSPEDFKVSELKRIMDALDVDIRLVPRH